MSAETVPRVDQTKQPSSYGGMASADGPFTSVSLSDAEQAKKKKVPRRILHFSDGILEEYSTDEDEVDSAPLQAVVDPKTLNWMPWVWFYVQTAACKAWAGADFCGEKLAWFFGITTPKYQSAIDEYYRRKAEDEREQEEEEKRLSTLTLNTELSSSSIDIHVMEEKKVVVGENLEKY